MISKLFKLETLISYYVSEKLRIYSLENPNLLEEIEELFMDELFEKTDFLFLNEFSLINREFFNISIKKILSEKMTNKSQNINTNFDFNLKCIYYSILINTKIEMKFNLSKYFAKNYFDEKINKIMNKFLLESEVFRKILLNQEDILNTKEDELIEFSDNQQETESLEKQDEKVINNNEILGRNKLENQIFEIDPFNKFLQENNLIEDKINCCKVDNKNSNEKIEKIFNYFDIFSYKIINLEDERYINKCKFFEIESNDKKQLIYILSLIKSFEIIYRISSFKIRKNFNKIKNYLNKGDNKFKSNNQFKRMINIQEISNLQENYLEYIINIFYFIENFRLFADKNNSNLLISEEIEDISNHLNINFDKRTLDKFNNFFYKSMDAMKIKLNENNMLNIKNKFSEVINKNSDLELSIEKKFQFWTYFKNKINNLIPLKSSNLFTEKEDSNTNFFNYFFLEIAIENLKNGLKNELDFLNRQTTVVPLKKKFIIEDSNINQNIPGEYSESLMEFIFNFEEEFKKQVNRDNLNLQLYQVVKECILQSLTTFIHQFQNKYNENPNNFNYLYFKVFLNKKIINALKFFNLEELIMLIKKLTDLYIIQKLKYIDSFLKESAKLILFENFTNNDNENIYLFTKTLRNIIFNLDSNFNFNHLNILCLSDDLNCKSDQEKYMRMQIKLCVIKKLILFYLKNVKEIKLHHSQMSQIKKKSNNISIKEFKLNEKIKIDYSLLRDIEKLINDKLNKCANENSFLKQEFDLFNDKIYFNEDIFNNYENLNLDFLNEFSIEPSLYKLNVNIFLLND